MSRVRNVVAPELVLIAVAAAAALGSCAEPPGIEGAPCPCPSGYFCDQLQNICISGSAPLPVRRNGGRDGSKSTLPIFPS